MSMGEASVAAADLAPPINPRHLVGYLAAIGAMVVAIWSGVPWFVNFVHLMAGVLWTAARADDDKEEKKLGEKEINRLIDLLGDDDEDKRADAEKKLIEHGEETRQRFMRDIAAFADETVHELDAKLKDVRIPRANLGPCPVCGHDIVENRKGFSCWSREDPGCGFVIWKSKAGKTLPPAVARELIARGRTEKAVTGFKGR